jgi:hypothetical protein
VVLRPVGDQPPSVYWVRRGLMAVVVLVVVGLAWWLWPSGDSPAQDTSAPATVSTSPSPTDSSSPTPTPSKTKKKEPKLKPACPDSAIEVTVSADAETYPAGQNPSFTFVVENVSDQTCSREVGQAANELKVTSGGAQVWSSDDCSPGGPGDPTNLAPADRFVQTVTWPRVKSAEGCPTPEESADPGSYQVVARNLEVLSEPAVFTLE